MPDDSNSDGRPLTYGEYVDAEAVFGDAIDYTQVRIYEGDYWGSGDERVSKDVYSTFDGEIFVPENIYRDDFSVSPTDKQYFLHEMTHVWQDQNYIDPLGEQVWEDQKKLGGLRDAVYVYELDGRDFLDYNKEQQGRIIEDYFLAASNRPWPGNEKIDVDDYEDLLPFDLYGGERLRPPANDDGDGASADIGSQPEISSDPFDQLFGQLPLAQPSSESAPEAAPDNPGASTLPNAGSGNNGPIPSGDVPSAEPSQRGTSPELGAPPANAAPQPAAAPASPPSEPAPTAQPLTPEDIANDPELAEDQRELDANRDAQGGDSTNAQEPPPGYDDRSQDEIGEEMEAALRGEAAGSDDDSEDEDEPEQPETDGSSEMPNPVDDGPSYVNDFSVLVNRNAPYVNPGPGDFDMPAVDGDIFDLLNRNAPAVNPGSGDFDMPTVSGDVSMLLNRNAPTVNPGLVDFDMPAGGDLSDLLDRNGPRQAAALDDADLAGSSVNDDLLSDFDFSGGLDDFAGFDIV